MEDSTNPAIHSSYLLHILGDPHLKLWTNLYDLIRGTFYALPLLILLGVVLKWGL